MSLDFSKWQGRHSQRYEALPKAAPPRSGNPGHDRLRYDRLDTLGKMSLRRAGRHHRLGMEPPPTPANASFWPSPKTTPPSPSSISTPATTLRPPHRTPAKKLFTRLRPRGRADRPRLPERRHVPRAETYVRDSRAMAEDRDRNPEGVTRHASKRAPRPLCEFSADEDTGCLRTGSPRRVGLSVTAPPAGRPVLSRPRSSRLSDLLAVKASPKHRAASGSSARTDMAMASTRSQPPGEVSTSTTRRPPAVSRWPTAAMVSRRDRRAR